MLYLIEKRNIISSQEEEYYTKQRKGILYQVNKKNITSNQEKIWY